MKSLKLHQLLAAMVLVFAASLSVGLESAEAHHSARKVSAIESATLGCVNRQRVRAGLFPVGVDRSLARAARFHSRNMARFEFFDHTDPAGREPWDRVALFDPRPWNVGENIGAGYSRERSVVAGWTAPATARTSLTRPGPTAQSAMCTRGAATATTGRSCSEASHRHQRSRAPG